MSQVSDITTTADVARTADPYKMPSGENGHIRFMAASIAMVVGSLAVYIQHILWPSALGTTALAQEVVSAQTNNRQTSNRNDVEPQDDGAEADNVENTQPVDSETPPPPQAGKAKGSGTLWTSKPIDWHNDAPDVAALDRLPEIEHKPSWWQLPEVSLMPEPDDRAASSPKTITKETGELRARPPQPSSDDTEPGSRPTPNEIQSAEIPVAGQPNERLQQEPAAPFFGLSEDSGAYGSILDDIITMTEDKTALNSADGNDIIAGTLFPDVIISGTGNDVIYAGSGNDLVFGGTGNDTIHGGEGNDVFVAEALDGDDVYLGGEGIDTVDFSGLRTSVLIDLMKGAVSGSETGTDILSSIENVVGTAANDVIIAGLTPSLMSGGGGSDTFVFKNYSLLDEGTARVHVITDFDVGDKIDISFLQSEHPTSRPFSLSLAPTADSHGYSQTTELFVRHVEKSDGTHTLIMISSIDHSEPILLVDLQGRHELTEQNVIL